jgi:nucleoside recognition membrane protein YjiH
MQAIAAAKAIAAAQAQTMLPALSPHLSHAAVVTGSKISAVVAAKLVTAVKAVAVTVSHFFWPFAVTIGVIVALIVLYKLGRLALEATPRGQRWLRKLRAFFSRRRTGSSTTLDRCPCSTPQ